MKALKGLAGLSLFLGLWYIFSLGKFINPLVFPSPLSVINQMVKDILSGELPQGIFFSLVMIITAFIPAAAMAFFMATGSFYHRNMERIFEFCSSLAHPLPGMALLPLLILWTGLGNHIIVLIVFHSVLWPLYINLRSGFKQVSSLHLDQGRNHEFSRRDIFLHILLPGSYPSLLAGLKIGWARSWRAVIAAEMIFGSIGSGGGLGWFIYKKRIFMDTPGMYGGIIILMIIGLLVDNLLFSKLETRLKVRWIPGP